MSVASRPGATARGGARQRADGFTLVELAIVLVVLGTLARALLAPLGERLERRRHDESRDRLEEVRRALVGHLVTRGVLPCPLSSDDASTPVSVEEGTPSRPCRRGSGHVPAAVLGVAGPLDANGALLDGWGRPLRYGVTLASDDRAGTPALADWLVPGEMPIVGLERLGADLSLCRVTASGDCPRRATRADALAFVVLSTGADATPDGLGGENLDGDRVYALVPPSVAPGAAFDDLLVWGSRDELAYWLVRAEWLP